MKSFIKILALSLLVILGLGIPNNSVQAGVVNAEDAEIQSLYIEVERTFSYSKYPNSPPSYIRYHDGRVGGILNLEDYIFDASTMTWTAWYSGYVSSNYPID